MKTFEQARDRIAKKSWDYDFEEMVEQLKKELRNVKNSQTTVTPE